MAQLRCSEPCLARNAGDRLRLHPPPFLKIPSYLGRVSSVNGNSTSFHLRDDDNGLCQLFTQLAKSLPPHDSKDSLTRTSHLEYQTDLSMLLPSTCCAGLPDDPPAVAAGAVSPLYTPRYRLNLASKASQSVRIDVCARALPQRYAPTGASLDLLGAEYRTGDFNYL